ncbi:MAG: hypothetical protein ABEI78_01975 [Candidatus Nanohaloarchaea archaeon]
MYNIEDEKAENILQENTVKSTENEQHFVFGRNDIYSFEEDKSIYSIVKKGSKTLLVHEYADRKENEREVSRVEEENAVEFLEKTGHEPFMKLDITRYILEDKTVIENVDQLGYFINSEEDGEEEVWYGNLLKEKMKKNQNMQETIKEKAQKILNKS